MEGSAGAGLGEEDKGAAELRASRPLPPSEAAGAARGDAAAAPRSAVPRADLRRLPGPPPFIPKRNDDGAGAAQPRTCRPRGIAPPSPARCFWKPRRLRARRARRAPIPVPARWQPAAPRCPSAPRWGGGRSPSRRGPARCRCRCRRPYLCPWAAGRCSQPLNTGMGPAPVATPIPLPMPMPVSVRAVSAPPLRSRPAPPHPRAPIGRPGR